MCNDDMFRDEKLQLDINKEAAKKLRLLSGKLDKYDYLKREEILPSDKRRLIEQAKFTYFAQRKTFEKQIETIGDQRNEQIKTIEDIKTNWVKLMKLLKRC